MPATLIVASRQVGKTTACEKLNAEGIKAVEVEYGEGFEEKLVEAMSGHDVSVVIVGTDKDTIEYLRKTRYPAVVVYRGQRLLDILDKEFPGVTPNDIPLIADYIGRNDIVSVELASRKETLFDVLEGLGFVN